MPYPNYILDVNGAGGEDFQSIVAAEAGMQTDFDNTQPVTLSCRAGTEIISASVDWGAGWTTPTGANTVTIQPEVGHEHGGVIGGPSYVMKMDIGFADLFKNTLPLSRVEGIQTWMTNVSAATHFKQDTLGEYRDIIGRFTATGDRTGEYFLEKPLKAINCVYYGATKTQSGMIISGVSIIEGCTFVNAGGTAGTGINRGAGTPSVKDCVIAGFNTDFPSGLNAASTNNASSDSTAATYLNPQTLIVLDLGVDFVDAPNGDLNPAPLGKLENTGVYLASTDPDIIGVARSDPPEIGAYEIAGAPPVGAELTLPTDTNETQTTATIGCTTDTAGGTLYWYVSTSATPPSAADLKAGTGAVDSGSLTPSSGANTAGATGLTQNTQYWHYWIQETV